MVKLIMRTPSFCIVKLSFDILYIHRFLVTLEVECRRKWRQCIEKRADSLRRCEVCAATTQLGQGVGTEPI